MYSLLNLLQQTRTERGSDFIRGASQPREYGPLEITIGVFFIIIVIGLIVWLFLMYRHQNRFAATPIGDEQVFQRICDVSELSKSEAYMVRKVVFELDLTNPIEIFTNPQILARYAETQGGNKAALVRNIRNKLFA